MSHSAEAGNGLPQLYGNLAGKAINLTRTFAGAARIPYSGKVAFRCSAGLIRIHLPEPVITTL
jgi:hypothetical protein